MIGGRMIAKNIELEKDIVVSRACVHQEGTYLQTMAVRTPMNIATVD
jgi:hypothetical protein